MRKFLQCLNTLISGFYKPSRAGILCFALFAAGVFPVFAQKSTAGVSPLEKTRKLVFETAKKSYPEINLKKIHIKTFKSETAFFKARFSIGRFLTLRKMRHLIYVNPRLYKLSAPDEGIRSIIAHELSHILYFTRKNRFELLGLAGLVSKGFTSKFERKADLEAIARGYGEGLIEYRNWLYKNIPEKKVEEKKRDYFSPEELKVMLEVIREKPEMIDVWRKKIPLNLKEIKESI